MTYLSFIFPRKGLHLELLVNGEQVFSGVGVPAGNIPADARMTIGTRHSEVEGF